MTSVSGAGKSTLVNQIVYPAAARALHASEVTVGAHDKITGLEHVDKVIDIDQTLIGRTPRSNPATYTKVFDLVREFFAELPQAKQNGYSAGRFSFNVKGGRCEACEGDGVKKVEMHFLPDVYVPCEVCQGKRFNEATLTVAYNGRSIADVLAITVDESRELFTHHPKIKRALDTLADVGLGYIALGQSSPTLSGGEAQRVKLSRELSKRSTGRTLYILDEPTTGLHFDDIKKLLGVVNRLVDAGNTMVVIEHNPTRPAVSDALAASRRTAIVEASETVSPAVVSITTTSTRQALPQTPFDFFFVPQSPREQQSFGTGFIIRENGLIITNQHVVSGADRIIVTLPDGSDVQAQLLGEDALTDIAVIKVERTGLRTAKTGRSTDLMIGEWVVALGNPFATCWATWSRR